MGDEKKDLMQVMHQQVSVETSEKEIQPQEMVDFASKAAKILKDIVTTAKTSIKINGNEYLKFEAWQTIGKFYKSTVTVEWTKPIMWKDEQDKDVIFGWEAKASVLDENGKVLGSAESSCSKEEPTWTKRANFQIRSMAQTRACAKALRQVYSWVVVLAGYQPTPAEEMAGIEPEAVQEEKPKPVSSKVTRIDLPRKCTKCGTDIEEAVYQYSVKNYQKPFCMPCQKFIREELAKIKPPN